MAQLRRDYNIELPTNRDSEYKEIVREERIFPSLMISKVNYLQFNLIFLNRV